MNNVYDRFLDPGTSRQHGAVMAEGEGSEVTGLKPGDIDIVMQRLMGDNKQRSARYLETWSIIKDSRPKEELMVHAAFESCAFKSALSCVAGW